MNYRNSIVSKHLSINQHFCHFISHFLKVWYTFDIPGQLTFETIFSSCSEFSYYQTDHRSSLYIYILSFMLIKFSFCLWPCSPTAFFFRDLRACLTAGYIPFASHRYREVTASNPVEVLNIFQASLRNCINCVHCDDHFLHFHIPFCFSRIHFTGFHGLCNSY